MSRRCCVPGCKQTLGASSILHNFPNPHKDRERFLTWVLFVGGEIVGLDNEYIFKNRRICHSHFEEKYFGPNKRIMRNSVPRLNLPVKEGVEKSTDVPQFRKVYIRSHNINDKSLNTHTSTIKNASSTSDVVEEASLDDFSMIPMREQINEESLSNHSSNTMEERTEQKSSDTHFSVSIKEKIEEESSNRYSLRLAKEYVKEESSDNHFSVPIEEKIRDRSSNNYSFRFVKDHVKEESSINYSLRLTEEHVEKEPSSNNSSSSIEQKNDDFSLLQIRKDFAVQYFNKLLTEKDSDTLSNSVFGILLAYEMEKVPARKKFECYNTLIATMDKYIRKE